MLRILLISLLLGACNTLRSSSSTTNTSSGSDDGSENETAKITCRKESVPGSHTRKRVCRTEDQLEASRESAQRSMQNNAPAMEAGEGQP